MKYWYPPRPLTKAPASSIPTFEKMGMVAQAKFNGSCGVLMTDGKQATLMGRNKNVFVRQLIEKRELLALARKGETVLVGEYMNKSQKDERGKPFVGFVVFDILVHEGKHLAGTTFSERQDLLASLYPGVPHNDWMYKISESIYRARNFETGLADLWKRSVKVEMIEGFVLKKPQGKLEAGHRENNNTSWQVKIRKETKNYKY